MRVVSADEIDQALDFPSLIDALAAAFAADWRVPVRHHHRLEGGTAPDGMLLLMPAWTDDAPGAGFVGTKIVSVMPGNAARGVPTVVGSYLLNDGATGAPMAIMDGTRLTLWRTAAASALAARYLARKDARRLLMVGTGSLAPYLVRAHSSVRPIDEVLVWGRNGEAASRLAAKLAGEGINATVTTDLPAAAASADVVSCATLSPVPVVSGDWLSPGAHLDLVGAFTPSTREADDAAVRRATLFVDTRGGALHEAGDIVVPLADGIIAEADIAADLFDLCRGRHAGRAAGSEITLFKSVGTALEDLAAAVLVCRPPDPSASRR